MAAVVLPEKVVVQIQHKRKTTVTQQTSDTTEKAERACGTLPFCH